MKILRPAVARLAGVIEPAAAGFAAIAGSLRTRQEMRFVEEDDGAFTPTRKIKGRDGLGVAPR